MKSILDGESLVEGSIVVSLMVILLLLSQVFDEGAGYFYSGLAIITFFTLFLDPKIDIPIFKKRQGLGTILALTLAVFSVYIIVNIAITPILVGAGKSIGLLQSFVQVQAERVPPFQGNIYLAFLLIVGVVTFLENYAWIRLSELGNLFLEKKSGIKSQKLRIAILVFVLGALASLFHTVVNIGQPDSSRRFLNNFFFFVLIVGSAWILRNQVVPWLVHLTNNLLGFIQKTREVALT